MARVAVDALGGDNAPDEVILGALDAAADGVEVTLFGPEGLDAKGLPLVVTTETIEMSDKPAEAVRAKPDSSLVAAVRSVAEGTTDAIVSAGNTGAVLAAGMIHLRRLPGVMRPAIAVPIPARDGPSVLLDAGANADARAEHLLQFAQMGAVFSRELLGVPNPEVRLLSIGEEDEKGNALTLDAHALLRESGLNFAGNAESRDLLRGAADVVVTDGFTGNIALKLLEGTIMDLLGVAARRDHLDAAREARWPPDPPGCEPPAEALRPGHLRGRLPARAARPGRDRARQQRPRGDRERDPAGRPRGRPPRRRAPGRAAPRARPCMIAPFFRGSVFPPPTTT